MLIHIRIENTWSPAGTAAATGSDPLPFDGWLELLGVISELVSRGGAPIMIGGISKVVIEVEDQERAKAFWAERLGFEVAQDAAYGQERWLEVRTPDKAVTVVLDLRKGERPVQSDPSLPTSNLFFYADDLQRTYSELTARGVEFPLPPVQQPFGWWSLFADPDGNRFALVPHQQ